jgi:hypothetical protein
MNRYFNSPRYRYYTYYGVRKGYHDIREDRRDEFSDDPVDEICYCNPKNTKLDELILSFSYLLTDCRRCFIDYGDYSDNEFEYEFDGNNKGTYNEFKNLIKQIPDFVFTKNNVGLYPLELVELLFQTYISCYSSYDNIKGFANISLTYLRKIKSDLLYEYLKYELVKNVAFRYIKNSNHIGNNAKLLQLPYEIWEHIFTFI